MNLITHSLAYQQISAALASLEQDERLCDEEHFIARVKAIDFLELHDGFDGSDVETLSLNRRVSELKQQLDLVNQNLFTRVIESIRTGECSTFKGYLSDFEDQLPAETDKHYVGYNEIDSFVWGLLEVDLPPGELQELEPEMVFYQPSSTKTILKLIKVLETTDKDIFYDLGSGLGHVPILVNLLMGIRTKGVEIQEYYCRYSNECLSKLELSTVEFIHADARNAEYDDGTIFYLYTPFRGKVLRHVLGKLEEQSKQRQIRVCTYGPCTAEVAEVNWLELIYQAGKQEGALAIFRSC